LRITTQAILDFLSARTTGSPETAPTKSGYAITMAWSDPEVPSTKITRGVEWSEMKGPYYFLDEDEARAKAEANKAQCN